MEVLAIVVAVLLVGGAAGYAFRGSLHKELGLLKADVYAYAARLEAVALKDAAAVKAEVLKIVAEIKAKL